MLSSHTATETPELRAERDRPRAVVLHPDDQFAAGRVPGNLSFFMLSGILFVAPFGFHTLPAASHPATQDPTRGVRAAAGVVNQADNRHLL